jgi:tRNA(Arg) A34 adenosine deaminase TadA
MSDSLPLYVKWMRFAMEEAEIALQKKEVPVGAIFVKHKIKKAQDIDKHISILTKENISELLDLEHGDIVARGHNLTNATRDV